MKAKSRAIGVDNVIGNQRILFLDFDGIKPIKSLRTLILKVYENYLILGTRKGYHVICNTVMDKETWENQILAFSNWIDPQYIEFSLKNGYSVLRISEKFSTKDNRVTSPAPYYVEFRETGKPYVSSYQHELLYKMLYRVFPCHSMPLKRGKLKLHFYLTGSD